ncbi:Na(+)/glucose symporter [Sedimentisphaera cyanobacteriorum]|uniref:Na(+)/glucose symporter n=1 Tax=Sedimentisphaera cyanobacteriorum TaxID=1940790 RepID=A0A1Q2HNT2_9BACT|nr:sodium/solute symporter [Sedimentisphaera cyanobacteriorum]AQQ09107.1 Na(+)/glucose symporter [Sedimentisphaera cyanobacteriorum]
MKIFEKLIYVFVLFLSIACYAANDEAVSPRYMDWTELPELPDSLGRAGMFSGVHNDALILAGGANFPKPVWESDKQWHNDIYVLTKAPESDSGFQWHTGFSLPRPLAYGASVSTEHGVVCMGGNDSKRAYSDVFMLSWNPQSKTIEKKDLPSLPSRCVYGDAAKIGSRIYVAGGTTGRGLETAMKNFWCLDLSQIDEPDNLSWQKLPPWPGSPRAFNITAVQHNGRTDCIYIMSGRAASKEGEVKFLKDVYEFNPLVFDPEQYNPDTKTYNGPLDPWRKRKSLPSSVMAGTAIGVGQSHIFVFGGADGSFWGLENELKDDHPGFPKKIYVYHTITDTWVESDNLPSNQVTTNAVRWGDDMVNDPIIIPSGEVRPRVRSAEIWSGKPLQIKKAIGWIDLSTIVVYLGILLGVGVFFSFRNKNSNDYFRGGQRVPWFVAGLSIFATMLSSITFIAIPAKAFMTDWVYFWVNMCAVVLAPFVIIFFLPFFRKIDATSAYEYLEKRFNRFVRLFASASFIFFQIGRMAVVMYLPALALAAITPLSQIQCIMAIGVLSLIYCTMGGLEAVVWTDAIQTFILLGGAFFSFALIINGIEGGFGGFLETASADNKFHLVNWDFSSVSFATTALWVVVLGGLGQQLVPYSSDMAVVQRYMSVSSMKFAKKSIWTNSITIIPASILFFGVGTALFVFYKDNPAQIDPTFKNDAIFPLFIARELPVGIAGLVVAGVFAAAQSTVSTSMNSTATAFVTDFIRPFSLLKGEKAFLRLGRIMTFTFGLLGVVLALLFATSDIKSLWDMFMTILGLMGGVMCGLFCLGIFTTRANGGGAVIGAILGAAGLYCVQKYTDVHLLLYGTIGIVLCVVIGYAASLFMPKTPEKTEGLTVHTLNGKNTWSKN